MAITEIVINPPIDGALIGIILLETAIVLGQWINHSSTNDEVLSIKISTGIKNLAIFLIGIGGFTFISYILLSSIIVGQEINIAIGILTGIVSGGTIFLLQEYYSHTKPKA